MYNIDFLQQIEKFQRYLGHLGCADFRDTIEEGAKRSYALPKNVEIIPCVQTESGGWVSVTYIQERLEKKVDVE